MPVAAARGVAVLAAVLAGSVLLGQQPAAAKQDMSAKTAKYKACFDEMLLLVEQKGYTSLLQYDDGNVTVDLTSQGPAQGLPLDTAEAQAGFMTDSLVDMFCAWTKGLPAAFATPRRRRNLQSRNLHSLATSHQESVRAATATDDSDFDEEYQRDSSRANLYKPHEAEYNKDDYSSSWTTLEIGGIVDSGDTKNRPSSGGRARTLTAERVFAIVAPVVKAGCDLLDCVPANIPLPPLVCIPDPVKLAAKICYVSYEVLLFAQQVCQIDGEAIDWVLNCINSAQLEATHENTKKNMDNQKIQWGYTKQRGEALSTALKDSFDKLHNRNCKMEQDVAFLQREVNYMRKLLLTPNTTRPGWACGSSGLTAGLFKTCSEPCALIPPRPCSSASPDTTFTAAVSPPVGCTQK